MTKWHKYREIKADIKSIIKNKENSHDSISKARVKCNSERLLFLVKDCDVDDLSSFERLAMYRDFSKLNKFIWVPIYIFDSDKVEDVLFIQKRLEELYKAMRESINLYMYFTSYEKAKEDGLVAYKARVIDFALYEVDSYSPSRFDCLEFDRDYKSQTWIKLGPLKNCRGLNINQLEESVDSVMTKNAYISESISKSERNFFFVKRIKKGRTKI